MQRVTREIWTKRIEQWTQSGLSAKEFAARLGLKPRTLAWWGWNLGASQRRKQRSRPPVNGSAAITKSTPATISPLTFVEMAVPISTDTLEVILPTTVRICVRPGFDDGTLGRLLDVLERRR